MSQLRHIGIILLTVFPLLVLGWACSPKEGAECLEDGSQGRIAYSSSAGGFWQIWAVSPNGHTPLQLTRTQEDLHYPDWSPDGKKLAYAANDGTIWIIKVGEEPQKLPNLPPNCTHPAWSPDGGRLAFACFSFEGRKEESAIWIADLEQNSLSRLTRQAGSQKHPAWSPDGSTIAYTNGYRVGFDKIVEELWLVNSDGSNSKALVADNYSNVQPAWSPDGAWLAFASNRSGNMDIWIIDKNGAKLQQLTQDRSYDGDPSWSPDGAMICFSSTHSGKMEIWVMQSSGQDARQITGLSGSDPGAESKEPHWSGARKMQ